MARLAMLHQTARSRVLNKPDSCLLFRLDVAMPGIGDGMFVNRGARQTIRVRAVSPSPASRMRPRHEGVEPRFVAGWQSGEYRPKR